MDLVITLVWGLEATQFKDYLTNTQRTLNIHPTHTHLTGISTHLNKGVDDTYIGTGIEDLAEARLSVDQL